MSIAGIDREQDDVALGSIFAGLTPDEREVLYLRYHADFPLAHVAIMLGRSQDDANACCSGAVKKLVMSCIKAVLAQPLAKESVPLTFDAIATKPAAWLLTLTADSAGVLSNTLSLSTTTETEDKVAEDKNVEKAAPPQHELIAAEKSPRPDPGQIGYLRVA